MNKYIEFINKLGLFSNIINLELLIEKYKIACSKPDNQACLANLKNGLDNYLVGYQLLLEQNHYRTRDELKKEILHDWESISKILLNDNYSNIRNDNNKLIYGMILEIIKEDLDFSSIYLFLVEHNLYDPNVACFTSLEPFYTILPLNDLILFKEANKKVILDNRTDFHILRNGSDIFEYASYHYRYCSSQEEKNYWHDYFFWALSGNLSVLDSKRFQALNSSLCWDYPPLVYQIYENEIFAYLADYLSTDGGILIQCQNALYPSGEQSKAIDFYIKELEKRNISNDNLLKLKKYSS